MDALARACERFSDAERTLREVLGQPSLGSAWQVSRQQVSEIAHATGSEVRRQEYDTFFTVSTEAFGVSFFANERFRGEPGEVF